MDPLKQLKQDIVSACRILSQQKLVEGFGHVSARIAGTDHFLITPRIGLALVKKTELLTMNLAGAVIDGAQPAPFEAWLHAAIMKAKPRVNAIARIHARGANIFSVADRKTRAGAQSRQLFCRRRAGFFQTGLDFERNTGHRSCRSLGRPTSDTFAWQWSGHGRENHP